MPDVQEVFRVTSQKVRPEPGFVDRQRRRQRRKETRRRLGAYVVVAAIVLSGVVSALRLAGEPQTPLATPTPRVTETGPGAFSDGARFAKPSSWEFTWCTGDECVAEPRRGFPGARFIVSADTQLPEPCSGTPTSPADLVAWLTRHPNLRTEPPRSTTVGGLAAVQLDATVARDANLICRVAKGEPMIPVMVVHEYATGRHPVGLARGERMRLLVLAEPQGSRYPHGSRTVAILIAAPEAVFEGFLAEAMSVVESMSLRQPQR